MINSLYAGQEVIDDLNSKIARMHRIASQQVLVFPDFTDFLQDVLCFQDRLDGQPLLGCGHVSPDVAIAADRAHVELKEILGASPFAGDTQKLLPEIKSGREIVYLANPSRITGANYSVMDLEIIAQRIPEGLLIVDEKLYDFYGISGVALIEQYPQLMVIRSLTAPYGISSDETGYVLADAGPVRRLREALGSNRLSRTHCRIMNTSLVNREALKNRLEMIHEEALALAIELNKLKVQNRITAGDFLLLRVAEPAMVGNFLTQHKVSVENLDGYPELKNYLRYTIQSELNNRHLINAFRKMPPKFYRMKGLDKRMISMKRSPESQVGDEEIPAGVIERGKVGIDRAEPERLERETVTD